MATEHKICESCGTPLVRAVGQSSLRWEQRRFCGNSCASRSRFKSADEIYSSQVRRGVKEDECWGWAGHYIKGYPNIVVSGKGTRASRYSYARFIGPIPEGMVVCHSCDNPACTNPKHLFAGTSGDNSADMVKKRRQSHGEASPHAKLTEQQARSILASREASKTLAARFGVARSTIYAIRTGDNWKSIRT